MTLSQTPVADRIVGARNPPCSGSDRRGVWPIPERRRTPLEVVIAPDGDMVRLRLRGELDLASYPVLERALRDAERAPQSALVVDLAELTFCDSGGVVLLVQADRRALARRRTFTLVNPLPPVMRLLEITTATHLLLASPHLEIRHTV